MATLIITVAKLKVKMASKMFTWMKVKMKMNMKMEMEMNNEGEVEDEYEDGDEGDGEDGGKVECEDCKQDVHQAKDQPDATPDYPRLHQTRSFLKET